MAFGNELEALLKEQLQIFKALEKISYEKTDIIVNNDLEVLEQSTKMEEGLIKRLGQAEGKRVKLLDAWGLDLKISMTEILEKIPTGKDSLVKIKEELTEVLGRIQERNALNNELINDNLDWLDFNMNLLSNVQTPTTYDKGQAKKGVNDSLFDRKV